MGTCRRCPARRPGTRRGVGRSRASQGFQAATGRPSVCARDVWNLRACPSGAGTGGRRPPWSHRRRAGNHTSCPEPSSTALTSRLPPSCAQGPSRPESLQPSPLRHCGITHDPLWQCRLPPQPAPVGQWLQRQTKGHTSGARPHAPVEKKLLQGIPRLQPPARALATGLCYVASVSTVRL